MPAAPPVSIPRIPATRRHPAPLAAAGLRRAARYAPPAPPRPRAYVPAARGRVTREVACEMYLITQTQLIGKSRQAHIVEARAVVAQALYEHDCDPESIGRFLGREAGTVLYLLRCLEKRATPTTYQLEALQMLRDEVRRRLAQLPRGAQV